MSKIKTTIQNVFVRPTRMIIPVPANDLDPHELTEQGKSDTVAKLYQDFVLGKLDPTQIGGNVTYDPEDATAVDPYNHLGLTFEETSDILEQGEAAGEEIKSKVAAHRKAKADSERELLKSQIRQEIEQELKNKDEDK